MEMKLTSNEAFRLAERYTGSKSRQINSYWLITNGYEKIRKQTDNIRKTYYIKQLH